MKRSKKIFLGIVAVFFIGLAIVSYDISQKTTFPGSKKLLQEELMPSQELDSTERNLDEQRTK